MTTAWKHRIRIPNLCSNSEALSQGLYSFTEDIINQGNFEIYGWAQQGGRYSETELFCGPKMLPQDILSSQVAGSQCPTASVASKRLLIIITRCWLRFDKEKLFQKLNLVQDT